MSSLYQSLVLFGSLIMFSKMVASVQSSLSTHHYKVQVHCLVYSQVHCRMVADSDPQFQSDFAIKFYKSLGIKNNPSTAYHLQTDGQTERVNQELEQYL